MQVEPGPVLELYREVGVVKVVADRLGLHYNTVRKIVLLDQGICMCGKPIVPGRKQCQPCLDYRADITDAKRQAALEEGNRCTQGNCRKELSPESSLYCIEHLERHRISQRKYQAKLDEKRGKTDWHGRGTPWQEIRNRILERDNYLCVLCLDGPDIRLHIHHIDEDRSHNEDSNLVTLCIVCHATITRLLEHPRKLQFFKFIDEHYHDLFYCTPRPG